MNLPNPTLDRRNFITRSAVGVAGALVVGIELAPGVSWAEEADVAATGGGSLGVYVTIGTDGTVTLVCPGAEMGQGITTSLPMILAEELMVDWSSVVVRLAYADAGLNRPSAAAPLVPGSSQGVGGSNSVRRYHDYLRQLGATTRQKLIWAASSLHSIPVADLRAENGEVVHDASGDSWPYADLVERALTMTPNDIAWVAPPYRIIGTSARRKDLPAKVNGSARFGIDVRVEGEQGQEQEMVFASVVLAPKVGQTVRSVGTPPAGVRVVELTNAAGAKVGIAAVHPRSTWDAMTAVKKITVRWNDAAFTAAIDSAAMETRRRQLLAGPTGEIVVNNGDAPGTLAATPSNRRITRTYSAPYLAHATMEVQNATALVTADGRCKVWAPTQNPTGARTIAAAVTGFTPDKIEVETTYLGGGFGRRADNEYVRQAVQVAKEMPGTPVKLVWSREEDFTHDLHRPASLATFDASVDANGALTALSTRVVCGHGKNSALEGLALRDILYTLPSNWRVEFVQDSIEVPLGFWRSVGHSQNTFFLESFLDEIAAATGKDPFTLRRELLSSDSDQHRRARAVLDRLEALSGWGSPAPSGRARGMAMTMGFGDTFVGQVAEVSGTSATSLKVHKVTVVVDPGSSINPDTVRAQMEGSVVEGLGAAWFNSVTFRSGTPVHRNFDSYRMLKMSEAPEIVTDIIESGAPMGGIGEPGLPPIAPAVANAFAKLTGNRMRSLPFASNSGGTTITPTPSITSFTPPSGPAGTVVTLTGVNFGGVTRVTFGGTTATFTAVSTTEIRATVPSRARTGTIAVTTAAGTGTSATAFTVTR